MSRRMLAIAGVGFAALLIGVVVVLVMVVADGDDEPALPPIPATLGGPTVAAPPEELQVCLEEQGIEPPEGPADPGRAPDPDQIEALEACAELLPGDPQGGPPGFGAPAG